MSDLVKKAVQPDGSLGELGFEFLWWRPGNEKAILDGEFTADELRAIADHMDRVNAERKVA